MSGWGQTWTLAGLAGSLGSSHFRPRSMRCFMLTCASAQCVGHKCRTPPGPRLRTGLVLLCAVLGCPCLVWHLLEPCLRAAHGGKRPHSRRPLEDACRLACALCSPVRMCREQAAGYGVLSFARCRGAIIRTLRVSGRDEAEFLG